MICMGIVSGFQSARCYSTAQCPGSCAWMNGRVASEFLQRAAGLCLAGLGKLDLLLAIAGILLDFRLPQLPIQFVKPATQLSVVGFM